MPKGSPLSDIERQIIESRLRQKKGIREIARAIGRHHSIVSRDIKNNGTDRGYNRNVAARIAKERASKTNKRKLDKDPKLALYVREKIRIGWSPEQIAGVLKQQPPKELAGATISHEAIYTWMYDGAGFDCIQYLRKGHRKRRSKGRGKKQKIAIKHRVSIHLRPKRITNRTGVGDWEDDTVICSGGREALASQYNRTLMLVRLSKVPDKSATSHEWALRAKIEKDPAWLWKSITRDNGTENVLHYATRIEYDIPSYFCDTYKSWQKGGVENINGLIRQYFPKSFDLGTIPHEAVQMVEDLLNNRPRKKLNYLTPNQALNLQLLKRSKVVL